MFRVHLSDVFFCLDSWSVNVRVHVMLIFVGGEVDLSTLVQLVSERVTNPPTDNPEDLREIFRLYDKDGRGFISVAEMHHLLTSVGEKLTDDEAEELLRMSGCVLNGMVAYESK